MEILDSKTHLRKGPPRKVSFWAAVKVLFDDYTVQIGIGILAVGMIFTQLSVGQSQFMELINLSGEWQETPGGLVEKKMLKDDFWKYTFEFVVDGEAYKGTSYGLLKRDELNECLVEYRQFNPRRSRIVGSSAELYPPFAASFLLLPFIGLIIISIGLKKNFSALYLLKYGILSQGKTINIKPVISLEGGGRAYNFVFEFKVKEKTYEASCITKEKERVEDDELYNILYDKRNPTRNIVYDALGHIPEIGQLGKIKQENPSSVFYLGIIFISVMINIYLYWSWYW
jgi:hypothetical protein